MGYYTDEARKAERDSKWWEAYRLWLCEGGDYGRENAAACKTIAEAIDKGDQFRELIKGQYERWENHEINSRELHDILDEAHNKVYGRGN